MEETQVRASFPSPPDHYKICAEQVLEPPPIPEPNPNLFVYNTPLFGVSSKHFLS